MPLIKARDLRPLIQELGFEKGTVSALESVLQEASELRQIARELTEMMARCVDTVHTLSQAEDGLRRTIEEMRRIQKQGDTYDREPS